MFRQLDLALNLSILSNKKFNQKLEFFSKFYCWLNNSNFQNNFFPQNSNVGSHSGGQDFLLDDKTTYRSWTSWKTIFVEESCESLHIILKPMETG